MRVPPPQPTRRAALSGAVASLLVPAPARATPRTIGFTVYRGESRIGTHRLDFTPDGATLGVDIAIELEVRFAMIPLYRYTHRSRETWQEGRLASLDARTDDNGDYTEVRARAEADGLAVEGSGGRFRAAADTKPTSYWMEAMTRRTKLLDTQRGVLIDVAARATGRERARIAGRDLEMRVYEVTGDLNSRLGYAENGEWVDLEFVARGARIRYRRDLPPAT
jgi:hypothetical protein